MEIVRLTEATQDAAADISKLLSELRELNPDQHQTTLAEVQAVIADKNIFCLVVKDGSRIVGMATLFVMQKFGKRIGHVEDVVISSEYRGKGLGETLMHEIITTAKSQNIDTLNLTSRPVRVAANKLYKKLGFEIKETNFYRMKF